MKTRKYARAATIGLLVISATWLGCQQPAGTTKAGDPQMAAYMQLVMPARIKVLGWTKPVSLAGDGRANALEAVVEARDAADELTKVVGTFHFELQTRKLSDQMGTRVAFWPVEVTTERALKMYRDPLSRFYHFPLQLENPLPAGHYTLSVWLLLTPDQRLYDELEFDYDGSSAPPPSAF
jgi:hypothetical protein